MTMSGGGIILYRTKTTDGIPKHYEDRWDYIIQDQEETWDYEGSCGQAGFNRTKRTDGIRQTTGQTIIDRNKKTDRIIQNQQNIQVLRGSTGKMELDVINRPNGIRQNQGNGLDYAGRPNIGQTRLYSRVGRYWK
jgi:hypothetical protein